MSEREEIQALLWETLGAHPPNPLIRVLASGRTNEEASRDGLGQFPGSLRGSERPWDSWRGDRRDSCCSMIIRVLLASDFSPVGIDFGIGKALQRILVRKEITVFGSATDNP